MPVQDPNPSFPVWSQVENGLRCTQIKCSVTMIILQNVFFHATLKGVTPGN